MREAMIAAQIESMAPGVEVTGIWAGDSSVRVSAEIPGVGEWHDLFSFQQDRPLTDIVNSIGSAIKRRMAKDSR